MVKSSTSLSFERDKNNIFSVASGLINNNPYKSIRLTGFTVNQNTNLVIINAQPGGTIQFLSEEVLIQLSTSNAANIPGGDRARKVRLIGYDRDFNIIVEDFELDGQNPVASINKFYRFIELNVIESGFFGNNLGNVWVSEEGTTLNNGTPGGNDRLFSIRNAWSRSSNSMLTIPRGFKGLFGRFILSARVDNSIFQLEVKNSKYDNVWQILEKRSINPSFNAVFDWGYHGLIPSESDIRIRAASLGVSTTINISGMVYLIPE